MGKKNGLDACANLEESKSQYMQGKAEVPQRFTVA